MKKKQVVVLGGGFGGLTFAKKFSHPDAEITIIDRQNHHLFQPLLYQAATAGLALPEISEPIRTIFADRKDIHVLMDSVNRIDVTEKTIHLAKKPLKYDYLIVALGMVTSYFGRNEWAQHTIGLKSLSDARRIRQRTLHAFEKAEASDDAVERRKLMTLVVIGGGPTGVEMAGSLCELTKKVFKNDFRSIRPHESRIVLIEAGERILGTYSRESSKRAQKDLEAMGVELMLNTPVKNIEDRRVILDGETIETESIIWTAGVEANPVVKNLPVEHDRRGRVLVGPDTSLPGYPEVFVIGDVAALKSKNGKEVPGVSPAAIQMGQHVAAIVKDEIKSSESAPENRPAFDYWDKGTMATIGRSSAVAEVGPLRLAGFPAWFLWLGVHLVFLIGFRNRLAVLLQWFYAYIHFQPGARVFENEEMAQVSEPVQREPRQTVKTGIG